MPTLELIIDSRKARAGAAQFQKAAASVKGAAGRATVAAGKVSKSFTAMRGAASGLLGPLGGVATAFLGIAGAAKTIKTIVDFEQVMATLKGVTGATAETLDRLSDTAREFGATTEFSATQAGEGLLFLARAGFTANESITALPDTLNLATAGMLELGEAADISSNILSAFGLEVSEMERVADTLVNTANSANTDIRQLAEAMKFAAPIAGSLGRSIEETAAAVGVLGNSGIQASMAGTNLRQIMLQLTNPTTQAKRVFERLGISLEDLDPTANSLTDIFERLGDANLQAADASQIFGTRNASAAVIIAKSSDKLRELTKANEDAKGAAAENARIMRDTLGGSLKALRSVIEELMLAAGDSGLTGTLKNVVEVVTDAVRILAGMEDKITGNEVAARRLATVIKLLAVVMALVVAVKIVGGIAALTVGLVNATVAAVGFAASMWPVLAVIAAIAVAAAGFELGKWLGSEFKIVQEVGAATANLLLVSWERINQAFALSPVIMAGAWNGMKQLSITTTDFIFAQFEKVLKGIDNAVNSMVRTINKVIVEAAVAAQAIGEEDLAQDILGSRLAGVNFSSAATRMRGGLALVRAQVEAEGVLLKEQFDKINNDTEATIKALDEILGEQLQEIQTEFATKTDVSFMEFLKKDIEAIAETIDLSGIGDSFAEGLGGAIDSIEGPLNALLEKLGFTSDQIEEITEQLKEVEKNTNAETVKNAASVPAGDVEVTPADRANRSTEDLTENMKTLKRITESAAGSVVNVFEAMVFGSMSAADAMKNLVKEIIKMVAQTLILNAIQTGINGAFAIGAGSPLPSANGNVFSGGEAMAFANGGVLNTSTFFPMANGGTGLAGEAGPEAIMPLSRDSRGKLGVVSAGGGGGTTHNTQVHINVTAKDANSFRQSETQISAGIAQGMQSAAARQSRRGG